jgi:hypothetical protein
VVKTPLNAGNVSKSPAKRKPLQNPEADGKILKKSRLRSPRKNQSTLHGHLQSLPETSPHGAKTQSGQSTLKLFEKLAKLNAVDWISLTPPPNLQQYN